MMTPSGTVIRWFEEVWNQKQEAAIDELMAPDAVVYGLGPEPLRGPAAFKPFVRAFCRAFPDLRVEVVRLVTEGELVVAHLQVTGTHTGDGIGGAPTGRTVSFEGMVIGKLHHDQIVQAWNCIDFLTMYQQVGWVSSPVLP